MSLFTRDQFASEGDDVGVYIDQLGRALLVWTTMQDRIRVTVAEAALAFNTTPEIIREAVEDQMWIFVSGDSDDPQKQFL